VVGQVGTSPRRRGRLVPLSRRAFRKLVYRRVEMDRYEVRAGDSRSLATPCPYELRFLSPGELDLAGVISPYLTAQDLAELTRQMSVCVVVVDGARVVASSWMTKGQVVVHELERVIDVPPDEHFSCRSYVDPGYRGRSLMTYMVDAYARRVPPEDTLWGLVYHWNVASIRSLEAAGWRRSGRCWTRFLFTRRTEGHELMPVTADPPGQGTQRRAH